jgi:hypothetical protein
MTDRIHRNESVPDWLVELLRLQGQTPQKSQPAREEVQVNVSLWDEFEARTERPPEARAAENGIV